MPSRSTWKKRASLLLSRLGSKRAAASAAGSSLVVQAGFPTSLADLYVKNRTKILPRKPNKHRPVSPNPIPNPNPIPPPTIAVRSPRRTAENSNTRRPSGLGLGFLVVVLGAVDFGKKWIVAVITILSLVLMVVEFFGLPEKNKKLGPAVVAVDLKGRGLVSPMRERSLCSNSATTSDVFSERSEISVERRDFDENLTRSDSASDVSSEMSEIFTERRDLYENPTDKKKKRLLKRLFQRKRSREKKESVLENKECLVDEDGDGIEFLSFEDDNGLDEDDNDIEFLSCEDDNGLIEVNSEKVVVNADGDRLRRRMKLGFLAIILFGLLGGKVVAVVLSIVGVLVFGCTGTVWRKWKLNLNEVG